MLNESIALALAAAHERDLRAESARRRLAVLARCCRPSELARTVRALRERWAGRPAATCCA